MAGHDPRSGLRGRTEEQMEITVRDLVTVLHGMGFGALFMLAFSGALAELYRMSVSTGPVQLSSRGQTMLAVYLIAMVVLAWLTVFSGAYIVYPGIGLFLLS